MDSTRNARWNSLPTEMKFTVMDNLDFTDLKSLSRSDSATYHACVPALFRVRYFQIFFQLPFLILCRLSI